jgi:hypothetical protein
LSQLVNNRLKEHFMRLTTKGRFAVTAMIDLGLRQEAMAR